MGKIAKTASRCRAALLTSGVIIAVGVATMPAAAAPRLIRVNADISTMPFTFTSQGGSFMFDGSGAFPTILSVQTGGAAVRTVFGTPSTDFTDRGTVFYDANVLGGYASFPDLTPVPFSNGENFLGLRVTSQGQNYYGFAYTTGSIFNGYGFETTPEAGITATTDFSSAIPEPGTWMMLLVGFMALGGTLRLSRRRERVALSYG